MTELKPKIKLKPKSDLGQNKTWTFTFSERVENHVGMETIGKMSPQGFTIDELEKCQQLCAEKGFKTELIDLNKNLPSGIEGELAKVLVIREGAKLFLSDVEMDSFKTEILQSESVVDKKAWMKGRVVNKLARYNLCYADQSQLPKYEEKKGTIIDFKSVPYLSKIRTELPEILGEKGKNLFAELNYYYDNTKTGISFHGDGERRLVVGLRMGASMSLHYQWFQECKPIGSREILNLDGNDLYIMSHKAVGTDWKKQKIATLRHAAGCEKYTTI